MEVISLLQSPGLIVGMYVYLFHQQMALCIIDNFSVAPSMMQNLKICVAQVILLWNQLMWFCFRPSTGIEIYCIKSLACSVKLLCSFAILEFNPGIPNIIENHLLVKFMLLSIISLIRSFSYVLTI